MSQHRLGSIRRWGWLVTVAGPALLFQQACSIDPDIYLRALLQVFSETSIFALDNLVSGLR